MSSSTSWPGLDACPFCGCPKGTLRQPHQIIGAPPKLYQVHCRDCGVQTRYFSTPAQAATYAGRDAYKAMYPGPDGARANDVEGPAMRDNNPLRRGVDGVCTRSTCECEREGLGDQCVWLKPA